MKNKFSKLLTLFYFLVLFFSCINSGGEKVIDIVDLRSLTEEEYTEDWDTIKQPQNHDVEVYRLDPNEEINGGTSYLIFFYKSEDDTLRRGPFGTHINFDYDKAYYHWQGVDTVLVRLENSKSKEYSRYEGTFNEDGSSEFGILEVSENNIEY